MDTSKESRIRQEEILSAIRDAIAVGARDFLAVCSQAWAGETVYGFLLEAAWEGTTVESAVGTEEGLLRIAQYYALREGKEDEESVNRHRTKLRWASPEDGWYVSQGKRFFDKANQLLAEAHEADLIKLGDQQLQGLCLDALRSLDADGVFGKGQSREKLTIGICDVGGDHSETDFLQWAEAVNSPVVLARLKHELQEAHAACLKSLELRFGPLKSSNLIEEN